LKQPNTIMVSVAFNPLDSDILAAGDQSEGIGVLDVRNGKLLRVLRWGSAHVVAFSPDGQTLVSAGFGGFGLGAPAPALVSWDFRTGAPLWSTGGLVYSIAFSPDGRVLAATGLTALQLWDSTQHKLLGTFDISAAAVFHPRQRMLATTFWDSIRLWKLRIDSASH
jgi:WD40 repeat protein